MTKKSLRIMMNENTRMTVHEWIVLLNAFPYENVVISIDDEMDNVYLINEEGDD